jgi:hypothetical protein
MIGSLVQIFERSMLMVIINERLAALISNQRHACRSCDCFVGCSLIERFFDHAAGVACSLYTPRWCYRASTKSRGKGCHGSSSSTFSSRPSVAPVVLHRDRRSADSDVGALSVGGAERINGGLKDDFGGRYVRVRGHAKVLCHLMFGILALTINQLMRDSACLILAVAAMCGNFGTCNCDVLARVEFDRAGCTGRVRNYVTNLC